MVFDGIWSSQARVFSSIVGQFLRLINCETAKPHSFKLVNCFISFT